VAIASQRQPVATFDLVVFGGTGDLAFRKLLPALYLATATGRFLRKAASSAPPGWR